MSVSGALSVFLPYEYLVKGSERLWIFFVNENCVWKLVLKFVVMKMFLILDDIDIICGKAEGVYW